MSTRNQTHVFLSFSLENQGFVETLARRLQGDARLSVWFGPWHSIPGVPIQEQMEAALWEAGVCAVFVGPGTIQGWQNEHMRTAIQTRVEDEPNYRIIPVLAPGAVRPTRRDLPSFLRRHEMVEFRKSDDEHAFTRLLAGIVGIPPIQVEGYLEAERYREHLPPPPSGVFEKGYELVIGVANYPKASPLPETVLDDARDLAALLTDPARYGYPSTQVVQLLDAEATDEGIRSGLAHLAAWSGPDDTAIVFFSGHGAHDPPESQLATQNSEPGQYILPYDCDPDDLSGTAIRGDKMTALLRQVRAGRLLVLFDSCHSGGAGQPKGALHRLKAGLSERYFEVLAQGKGRAVIASSRPDEYS